MIAVINDKKPTCFANSRNNTKSNYRQNGHSYSTACEKDKKSKRPEKFLPHLHDKTLYKSLEDQRFNLLFYYKFALLSYKEIAEKFKIKKSQARGFILKQIKLGLIGKENNLYKPDLYLPSKGRNCLVQGINYYRLTKKGREHQKEINHEAIQKCKDRVGAKISPTTDKISNFFNGVVNTLSYPNYKLGRREPRWGLSPTRSSFSSGEKKIFLVALDHSLNKLDRLVQGLFNQRLEKDLPRKKKKRDLKPRASQINTQEQRNSFRETEKFRAIQEIFTTFGFKKFLNTAYRGTLLRLLTLPLEYIQKLLKLMKHKIKKGWKLQSFWGFFMSEVRKLPDKRRFADPWFKMLSKEYRDASDGKRNKLNQGVDSSIIVQGISKLERETGEKASEKVLEQFLYHGTQKFKSTIDAICYRMSLGIGELPKEKAQEEEVEKPKSRPILKQVKVNLETKEPYTTEDLLADKPFTMVSKIVGHEPIKQKNKLKTEEQKKKKAFSKINSWIRMAFYALKLGSPEAIHKAFFAKREKVA